MQIEQDGTAVFRTMTRMITVRVYVDRDLLCERSKICLGANLWPRLQTKGRYR
jgi:adenylate cyclase